MIQSQITAKTVKIFFRNYQTAGEIRNIAEVFEAFAKKGNEGASALEELPGTLISCCLQELQVSVR